MKKKEQSGILGKIFGSSKKDSCCAIEIEEIPATQPESKKKNTEVQPKENHQKKGGCGCCG